MRYGEIFSPEFLPRTSQARPVRKIGPYFKASGLVLVLVAHPPVFFSGPEVVVKAEHKHLSMILDSMLGFQRHVREAIIKARKGIGINHFLSKYVSRNVLDQIYKLYVRPHLDYGDIVYHRYDLEFAKRLESIQYSATLVVSGTWRRTNTDKLYEELSWEILYYRRWCGRTSLPLL